MSAPDKPSTQLDPPASESGTPSLDALLQEREARIARLEKQLQDKDAQIASQRETLNAVLNSKGWKLLDGYRRLKQRVLRRLPGAKKPVEISFQEWFAETQRLMPSREHFVGHAGRFAYRPLISLLMCVGEIPAPRLRATIDSVRRQYYSDWELCVCDETAEGSELQRALDEVVTAEPRIRRARRQRGGTRAEGWNRALDLATGEFVSVMDEGDEIAPEALFEVVRLLQADRTTDVLYSDEDRLDDAGEHTEPFFKPDWSPDLLLSRMYIGRLGVYRKSWVDRLGGFRSELEDCQHYDLALRLTELTQRIRHAPRILYHRYQRPSGAPADESAGQRRARAETRAMLEETMSRRGVEVKVTDGGVADTFRVRRKITDHPMVSIIVPTKDRLDLLSRCIRSIEDRTSYPNFEILIVDHESVEPRTLRYLERSGHRVIRCEGPFNFPRLNNVAAEVAGGSHLLFLNNDTRVENRDWLDALVEHGQRDEVGAVGAKLLYPDGRIQHAGVVLGVGGVANHAYRFVRGQGRFGFVETTRNYSAVTAACMMVRKEIYDRVGGFDEGLPVNFNDVDLCLKIRKAGYLVVYTPHTVVTHYESASRPAQVDFWEGDLLVQRWASLLENDPYYNENLSRVAVDFSLGPPRPYNVVADVYQQYVAGAALCELARGRSVGQTFRGRRDNLTAISIVFGTYGRRNFGRLRFVLREGGLSGELLVQEEIEVENLMDNQSRLFWFPPLPRSNGASFYFGLEGVDGTEGSSVTVWASPRAVPSVGTCYQDGRVVDRCLTFATYALRQW